MASNEVIKFADDFEKYINNIIRTRRSMINDFVYDDSITCILDYNLDYLANILGVSKTELKLVDFNGLHVIELATIVEALRKRFNPTILPPKEWLVYPGAIEVLKFDIENEVFLAIHLLSSDVNMQEAAIVYTGQTIDLINKLALKSKNTTNKAICPILDQSILDEVFDNTIGYIQRAKELKKYNVPLRRGIILYGEPGNGKTMLLKWIKFRAVKENMTYREITNTNINDWAHSNILSKNLNNRNILFFDDVNIEMFSRSRSGDVASALLVAMDGMSNKHSTVIRIFSTNENV